MPKELIKSSDPVKDVNDPDCLPIYEGVVAWSRVGWVQLATTFRKPVPSSPEMPGHFEQPFGYYVNLDRDGINRLIRALRKARDQALGADA